MNVFELFAKITLDKSEYDTGLKQASADTQTFGSKLKSGLATAGNVAMGALAAGTAAVTAFGAKSVKTGMQFDESMAQVAATLGLTMDDIQTQVGTADTSFGHFEGTLREFAQFMGANTAFSATEAADALNYMALAGYDAQQSMDMLPNVLNLAAAGAMDLATASDMITDSQSALGLSFEQTNTLVDQMAMAASKSNTSVSQLGSAILTVGGTAKNLKGGTTELATALGILADNGIKGAEGGTKLRNMITSLTSPTDKASKLMEELGVSAFDAQGNMKPLNQVFSELSSAMSTMTQEGRMNTLSEIFNARDIKAAEAMLANYSGRWDELSGYVDDAKGSATKMADTQLDNLKGDVTILKSAFEGLQISISDKLAPDLRNLIQDITVWVGKLTDKVKSGALNKVFDNIKNTLKSLVPVLKEFIALALKIFEVWNSLPAPMQKFIVEAGLVSMASQKMGLNFGTIVNAALSLSKGLKNLPGLFGGITKGAEGLKGVSSVFSGFAGVGTKITTAFSSVGTVIAGVMKVVGGIGAVIGGAILAVKNFVSMWQNGWDVIKAILEALGIAIAAVGAVILGAPAAIAGVVAAIIFAISQLAIVIHDNWEAISEFFSNLATGIKEGFENAIEAIGQFIATIKAKVAELYEHGKEAIGNFIDGIGERIEELIEKGREVVGNLISGITERVGEIIEKGREAIGNFLSGLQERVSELIEHGKEVVGNFIAGIMERAGELIEQGKQTVGNFISGITERIEDIIENGRQIVGNFITGIQARIGELIEKGKEAVGNIVDGIKQRIREVYAQGIETISNFISGIRERIGELVDNGREAIANVISGIKERIGDLIEHGKETIGNFISGLQERFRELIDKGVEIIQSVSEGVASKIKDFIEHGKEVVGNLVAGIKERIKEALDQGKDIINNIIQGIKNAFTNLKNTAGDIIKTIKDGIKDKINEAKSWGSDLINNFIDGLKEKWNNLKNTVSDIAQGIKDFLGFSVPEKGPLADADTYAPDMMKLFAKGIRDNANLVTSQIEDTFNFGNLIKNPDFDLSANVSASASGNNGASAGSSGFTQNITINAPTELDPSETARKTKIATQQMVLAMMGAS